MSLTGGATYEYSFSDAGTWSPGTYALKIHAVDAVGNVSDFDSGLTLQILVDSVAPGVSEVTMDRSEVYHGASVAPVNVTAQVEDFPAEAEMAIALVEAHFVEVSSGGVVKSLDMSEGSAGSYSCAFLTTTTLAEGTYELWIYAADAVGNYVEHPSDKSLVVLADVDEPVISNAVMDPGPVYTGPNPVYVSVSVDVVDVPAEAEMDIDVVRATLTREGEEYVHLMVGGSGDAFSWTFDVSSWQPAEYDLTIYAEDAVGNGGSLPTGLRVTVVEDLESPVISGVSVDPDEHYQSASPPTPISVQATVIDQPTASQAGVSLVEASLELESGGDTHTLEMSDTGDGAYEVFFPDVSVWTLGDYTLKISAIDGVGNEDEETYGVVLSILADTEGPDISAVSIVPDVQYVTSPVVPIVVSATIQDEPAAAEGSVAEAWAKLDLQDGDGSHYEAEFVEGVDGTWSTSFADVTSWTTGVYLLTVEAQDALGNPAVSVTGETLSVLFDDQGPEITLPTMDPDHHYVSAELTVVVVSAEVKDLPEEGGEGVASVTARLDWEDPESGATAAYEIELSLEQGLGGGGEGNTIIVPDQFLEVQDAIEAASNGQVILVRQGTYKRINFLGKAITVRSESGPEVTILDGEWLGTVVTFETNEGPNSILDGFTVTNGLSSGGGGIACNGTSPTILNNIIEGNEANQDHGGGVICSNPGSSPSHATFIGNRIRNNTAAINAGGVYIHFSSPTFINNVITGNSAPGLAGGIHIYYSSPVITNNTITNNSAGSAGGGIYGGGDGVTITNTIIWGNSAYDDPQLSVGPLLNNCNVEGGWEGGANNIAFDPQFEADGYHLGGPSPCRDAGVNDPVGGLPETDIDGEPRIGDDVVDIGADEYYGFYSGGQGTWSGAFQVDSEWDLGSWDLTILAEDERGNQRDLATGLTLWVRADETGPAVTDAVLDPAEVDLEDGQETHLLSVTATITDVPMEAENHVVSAEAYLVDDAGSPVLGGPVSMTSTGAADEYHATLGYAESMGEGRYILWIEAIDSLGNSSMTEAALLNVYVAPTVWVDSVTPDPATGLDPVLVGVRATDASGIASAVLEYRLLTNLDPDPSSWISVSLTPEQVGEVPDTQQVGPFLRAGLLEVRATATDLHDNTTIAETVQVCVDFVPISIEVVDPPFGPAVGSEAADYFVTITGPGLTTDGHADSFVVRFGDQVADIQSVIEDSILVVAPDSAMGPGEVVDVAVETTRTEQTVWEGHGCSGDPTADSFTLFAAYEYPPAPTATGIDPTEGPVEGGTLVQVTGEGFQDKVLPGSVEVSFGGEPAVLPMVISDTEIEVRTPPRPETVDVNIPLTVRVSTSNGDAVFPMGFQYGRPFGFLREAWTADTGGVGGADAMALVRTAGVDIADLAVGVPSGWSAFGYQTGFVKLVDFESGVTLAQIDGAADGDRFGEALGSHGIWTFVGAPGADGDSGAKRDSGRLYAFRNFDADSSLEDDELLQWEGEVGGDQLGVSIAVGDPVGDGSTVVVAVELASNKLLVGDPENPGSAQHVSAPAEYTLTDGPIVWVEDFDGGGVQELVVSAHNGTDNCLLYLSGEDLLAATAAAVALDETCGLSGAPAWLSPVSGGVVLPGTALGTELLYRHTFGAIDVDAIHLNHILGGDARLFAIADLNEDGEEDWGIVDPSSDTVLLVSGVQNPETLIHPDFFWRSLGEGETPLAGPMVAGDLNADGLPDLVALADAGGALAWTTHPGPTATRATQGVLYRVVGFEDGCMLFDAPTTPGETLSLRVSGTAGVRSVEVRLYHASGHISHSGSIDLAEGGGVAILEVPDHADNRSLVGVCGLELGDTLAFWPRNAGVRPIDMSDDTGTYTFEGARAGDLLSAAVVMRSWPVPAEQIPLTLTDFVDDEGNSWKEELAVVSTDRGILPSIKIDRFRIPRDGNYTLSYAPLLEGLGTVMKGRIVPDPTGSESEVEVTP
jgi:hypothetical protein